MNFNKYHHLLASLGLFLLALIPRGYDLAHFVTADEAKWVYRSAQFLNAFLKGDYPATQVNLTPAVTTTWLGSLSLTFYYKFQAISQPFPEWLQSLPEFRTDLDLLVATRWPFVILTSLCIVIIYHLVRQWLSPQVAWVGAALIALDPHTVSLSRVLGHDAPATFFLTLALLALLTIYLSPNDSLLATSYSLLLTPYSFSAIFAGLAFLSKAPTLFLIPFTALMLGVEAWRAQNLPLAIRNFTIWLCIAYLTVIIGWPAAWSHPIGAPYAVIENAFISATDHAEAEAEGYWQVPDLGLAYYPINGLFKLSPLVLVGVIFALLRLWQKRYDSQPQARGIIWLLAFALLFTMFMTLGDKRSPRYILPIFPALALVAAWGWQGLLQRYQPSPAIQRNFYGSFVVAAGLILWPYSPYYLTYYNPLVGGAWTAPHWVKIGWGEGLDEAGRFLQQSASFQNKRVSTVYASTVAPYFSGKLSGMDSDNAAAIVLYIKQVQSGEPSVPFIRYFQYQDPLHSVELNGLHYADIYAGPPLIFLENQPPLAYRPLTPFGTISETLKVDVLWLPNNITNANPTLTLQPVTGELSSTLSYQAPLQKLADEVLLSQHIFTLPPTLRPGDYQLALDQHPLGQIALRNFQPPPHSMSESVIFGNQIALLGYQFDPTEDYIQVKLTWQAQTDPLPDYTMFVHLLDEQHQQVAGWEARPMQGTWPTHRWLKGEVVPDEFNLAVPPQLPNGAYQVVAGIIDPATQQRLPLDPEHDTWAIPWTFIWEKK